MRNPAGGRCVFLHTLGRGITEVGGNPAVLTWRGHCLNH
jgi:hypothetical protein